VGRPLLCREGRCGTAAGEPVLQLLQCEVADAYDQLAVHRGRCRAWSAASPAHRNGDASQDSVLLGLARPARPQIRVGQGGDYRLRQCPGHLDALMPFTMP